MCAAEAFDAQQWKLDQSCPGQHPLSLKNTQSNVQRACLKLRNGSGSGFCSDQYQFRSLARCSTCLVGVIVRLA